LKILSIARDITKRKQAQEKARINQTQLAHAARVSAMGEMATGLAHELNQPLAAMAAYVDGTLKRLEGGEPLTDDIFKALHKASAQAHRAGEIIRRLRDFIGNIETRTEPIDLNQTIQTVAEMMDAELRLAEVKLDLNFERPLPLVAGDPILIQQVIFNLARNGVEAMAGNSAGMRTIKIDTSAKNNNVRISINDTGPGISEGDQAKLFDPFFTTKETGLGMGLAICHSIIDDIGGRIWFECQGGIGSVFHIDLPELEGDGTNADLEKLAS
ncbi:MAG: PAS domain-containing sensor histidine kinase, partial [Rhodospirillales bacterium]|nr:PAS domain-containing sensor histidine kinase [Rhodospirillales bacterium]